MAVALVVGAPVLFLASIIASSNATLTTDPRHNLGIALGPMVATSLAIAAGWVLAFIPGRVGPVAAVTWTFSVLETVGLFLLTLAVLIGYGTPP